MFSGPGDMRFVSFRAFEPTACEKCSCSKRWLVPRICEWHVPSVQYMLMWPNCYTKYPQTHDESPLPEKGQRVSCHSFCTALK